MELFKFEEAHKSFDKVLEIEPKNAQVKFLKMLILNNLDKSKRKAN